MTAFNMWKSGDQAFILNDTAQYLPTSGEVVSFVPKTVVVKNLKAGAMALTTTGAGGISEGLQAIYDTLRLPHPLNAVEILPDLLSRFEDGFREKQPHRQFISGIGIALFCPDQKRPILLLLSNVTGEVIPAPYEPYTIVETGFFLTGNGAFGPFDPDVPYTGCEGFDADRDGLAMIEAQRRQKFAEFDIHAIGGQAVLTTISARGVTSKVLQTWPDRVGEKIQPELMAA